MIPIDRTSIDHTQKEHNIRELQMKLRGLSFADDSLPRPAVTGIQDQTTDAALRAFQKTIGLEETGNADLATWQALDRAHRQNVRRYTSVSPLYPVGGDAFFSLPYPKPFLLLLQVLLMTLSQTAEVIAAPALTGIYDEQTAQAVSAVQSLAGLSPTGILDAAAWDVIAALYNLDAKKYLASPPIKPPAAMPSTEQFPALQ